MRTGFVDSIKSVDEGRIKVEHRDLGIRIGKVDLSKPPAAVNHTMEVDHIDISWGNGAAHFALGNHSGESDRRPVIQQTIPLGWMATALANPSTPLVKGRDPETNRWARLQVENAWFSSLDPYLPNLEHQVLLASLMEFAEQELGIPERRPWPDELDRPPMATTSYYRRQSKWGLQEGWFKHAEVSQNHHWDDGSLKLRALLKKEYPPDFVDAYQLMAAWRIKSDDPHRERVALSPHFSKKGLIEDWMVVADDDLRRKVWRQIKQGHRLYIAERRVAEDKVRKRAA